MNGYGYMRRRTLLNQLAIPIAFLVIVQLQSSLGRGPPPDIAAARLGFSIDRHTITTSDGYILDIFRYTGGSDGKVNHNPIAKKPTVYMIPGLGCNAGVWLVQNNNSLPNLLANAGFEVWLGNLRGSQFGRKHLKYSTNSNRFWNFGWNENALLDVAESLNYIKETSGQEKIQFVGHSLGSTLFFVLNALTTEYHSFISDAYLLAPVVYLGRITSPSIELRHITLLLRAKAFPEQNALDELFVGAGAPNTNKLFNFEMNRDVIDKKGITFVKMAFLHTFSHDHFAFQELKFPEIFHFICQKPNLMCELLTGFRTGDNNINEDRMRELSNYYPDDISTKQLLQYEQHIHKVKKFHQLSYGWFGNKKRYGKHSAPSYNITNIPTPISLYVGSTDNISTLKDAKDLSKTMPNVKRLYITPFKKFRHSDFVVGNNAPYLYSTILQHMLQDLSHAQKND